MQLNGKVAIVTGAGGGGCGRAISHRLAQHGASVIVSDVDEAGGRETVRHIEADGGRAAFFAADVAHDAEVRALVESAERRFGGLDVMVNNAGPYFPGPLEQWIKTVQANLLGTMHGTLHALEAMERRGGGAIVNMGSTSALGHGLNHSPSAAYEAAKAGVMRLTTALGWLAEQRRIRVNCLVPHWVATEEVAAFVAGLTPEQRTQYKVPDVLVRTEEVAQAVVRLATDEALAGRILVYWGGRPPSLITQGDPGYSRLETES
jgi:NAD(P)-dependent dehydrogenase (short-subunit alcohol dehydrogenase family)